MTKKQKRKNNKKSHINIHGLPFIGFKFCLVIGEDETDILCDGYGIDKKLLPNFYGDSTARCSTLTDEYGNNISVVRLLESDRYKKNKDNFDSIVGLLCHECVHVAQDYMQTIGEDKPSAEFQAYIIQFIFTNLLADYRQR